MGRVLHLGPSWHGPSFMLAELAGAELVLGRVVLHPYVPTLLKQPAPLQHSAGQVGSDTV